MKRVWIALAMLTTLLAGCSSAQDAQVPEGITEPTAGQKIAPSLTAVITQELARPDTTPEVREILQRAASTGEVTSQDYEAAFARYAQCVKDAGLKEDYTKEPTGLYSVMPHYSTQSVEAAKRDADTSNACGVKHVAAVEIIYNLQRNNPDLLADPNEVAVRCLIKQGAVPSDYSAAKFKKVTEGNLEQAPFDVNDPNVAACLSAAGMAAGKGGS